MGLCSVQIDEASTARQQLESCSFACWYSKFEKIALRGRLLKIPANVVTYLQDEIVVLPKECYPNEQDNNSSRTQHSNITWNDNDRINEDDQDDDNDDAIIQPEFPEFSKQISKTIGQFRGRCAFVKTQWHCPKDAFWITAGQTLKCTDITDVYQLLKASSIVKQDLCHGGLPEQLAGSSAASDDDTATAAAAGEHYLILKEWLDIHPGTEFRCFVRNNNLIAISPRDWPAYHQHIVQQKLEICNDIMSVYKEKIKGQFSLSSYVFDVVRLAKDHVLLVDFAPFNPALTDSLAYEWKELFDANAFVEEDDPEFRYLPNDCGIQPSKRNNYGIPIDIVDMFGGNGSGCGGAGDLTQLVNRLEDELRIDG